MLKLLSTLLRDGDVRSVLTPSGGDGGGGIEASLSVVDGLLKQNSLSFGGGGGGRESSLESMVDGLLKQNLSCGGSGTELSVDEGEFIVLQSFSSSLSFSS